MRTTRKTEEQRKADEAKERAYWKAWLKSRMENRARERALRAAR